MFKFIKLLVISYSLIVVCMPLQGRANEPVKVSCSVTVDYVLNGVLAQTYQKDFIVEPGAGFADDFSTPTRFREFTASTVMDAGKTVVGITYFNDVGVFNSIDFSTKLTLHKKGVTGATSGSHTFTTTLGVPSQQQHTTNYTLSCLRSR